MNALGANITKSTNNAAKNVTEPLNSSLVQLGNSLVNGVNSFNTKVQNGFNSFGNGVKNTFTNTAKAFNLPTNVVNAPVNSINNAVKNSINSVNNSLKNANIMTNTNTGAASETPGWVWFAVIFLTLVGTFVGLFYYFAEDIQTGYNYLFTSIRGALGLDQEPIPTPPSTPPTTEPPSIVPETEEQKRESENILEKVLPIGRSSEVFNVSKNDFTYYDAEPLCKALGAELATYEQVKEAYEKGADWCNYGWVKGQVALYPTQKATWEDLQKGPEDERGACGKPGLNGGFFDNPEMRFGVNCYGPKPSQSAHDEAELMREGRIPRSTASLKIDQKVREFEAQADAMGILPFNKGKWATA